MLLSLIAIFVFSSVYIFSYQAYLYRRLHVSLVMEKKRDISDELLIVSPTKTNSFRKFLKVFSFLAKFKGSRALAGHSVPERLIMAGHPVSILEFVVFKVLALVISLILGTVLFTNANMKGQILFIIIGAVVGFLIPDVWLILKIKRRHSEIRRDLPAVIDLLNLCVGAGLDFMLAVNRVIKDFKKCSLIEELQEVWRETRMGASRREALQHLSRRVKLPELSSFVRTLLQADRMGSPMDEALKIQAEELRLRRYLNGEEAALKAPIKLLFPLFIFILPAVLVVVAGPVFLQFMRGGIKF